MKRILITRNGKPAAMLVPAPKEAKKSVKELIAQMKALRKGNTLGKGLTVRGLIEEGRRF